MLRVGFQAPSPYGIDWSNPDHIRGYLESNNESIRQAFDEIARQANNPNYILIGGEKLSTVVEGAKAWKGDLKLFTGTMSNARSWGRKHGWAVADGTNGTPDFRHKFIRGADKGEDAGDTGGSDTHTHEHELTVPEHTHAHTLQMPAHTHAFSATTGATSTLSYYCLSAGATGVPGMYHSHTVSGTTASCGPANITDGSISSASEASVGGTVTAASTLPAYYEVIVLVKL